jgi:hypothetical protein
MILLSLDKSSIDYGGQTKAMARTIVLEAVWHH